MPSCKLTAYAPVCSPAFPIPPLPHVISRGQSVSGWLALTRPRPLPLLCRPFSLSALSPVPALLSCTPLLLNPTAVSGSLSLPTFVSVPFLSKPSFPVPCVHPQASGHAAPTTPGGAPLHSRSCPLALAGGTRWDPSPATAETRAAGERTAQAEDAEACVSESVADYRHSTLPHLQPQSSLKSKTYNKTQSGLGWVSTRALPCGPGIWKATEPPQY